MKNRQMYERWLFLLLELLMLLCLLFLLLFLLMIRIFSRSEESFLDVIRLKVLEQMTERMTNVKQVTSIE